MGLSKHKYLLLLLHPPHASICTHKLRNLILRDENTCSSPMTWALSSSKDSKSQGGGGGTESGSLCPNLGRFGCDDKDTHRGSCP